MSASAENLARQAMALPAPERAALAHRLIASLDDAAEVEAETAADSAGREEALRRMGEIERGEAKPISHEEIFRRVRRRLAR